MPVSREILESSYRLGRMKKVKMFIYITQAALIIIMLIIWTILTSKEGFPPKTLPFGAYVLIIALMLLIIDAEGFFLKLFGIRWAKSDSEKFLMAKDYIKRGIVVIIVAGIVIAMINILAPIVDEGIDTKEKVIVYGHYDEDFTSQDPLGITGVRSINVVSDDDLPLDIYILRKDDYNNGYYGRRLNLDADESVGIMELDYKTDDYLKYGDYVLYISSYGENANVTYSLKSSVSQAIVLYLTVFPAIFAGMNAAWVAYLWPLKKRYKKTSIYE